MAADAPPRGVAAPARGIDGRRLRSKPASNATRAWRRFRANKLAVGSLAVLGVLVVMAVAAPLISEYVTHRTPTDQQLVNRFQPTSREHWLGTDEYGRDVLTRIAYGGRVSLGVAALAALVAVSVGTLVGALAAYYGGWVDMVLMRFVDVMLVIPFLFLLILIGTLFRIGPIVLAMAIALLGWFGLSRLVRAEILSIRRREYVEAARVVGAGDGQILRRHIIPNASHLIIIWVTIAVPGFILTEASLSFLGLGVQPPTPSWGNMLTNSTQYLYQSKGLIVIPAVFITITVLVLSIIGYALRDALDPRLAD